MLSLFFVIYIYIKARVGIREGGGSRATERGVQVGDIWGIVEVRMGANVVDKEARMWYDKGREGGGEMSKALDREMQECPQRAGVLLFHQQGRLIAMGVTENAAKDIRKAMWELSADSFVLKISDDPAADLARWRAKLPGVQVWEVSKRRERVKKPVPDWKHKNIYSVTTGKRIG